jgi:hypothetical protein
MADEKKKRSRWPWLLPIFFCCLPCVGFSTWSGSRMKKTNRAREAHATRALAAVEAFKADAGSYPELLEHAFTEKLEYTELIYEPCAKSRTFLLSYVEAAPGFLPSDFAATWNPETKDWKSHDMGQPPPCE